MQRLHYPVEHVVKGDDVVGFAHRRQSAADGCDDDRPRKIDMVQSVEDFIDRRDVSARSRYWLMHMRRFLRGTILPIGAAQGVRCRLNNARTFLLSPGSTAISRPPLVCASLSKILSGSGVLFQSTNLFAVSKLSRLPPGMQSRAIRSNTSAAMAGTRSAKISALTPLARHIDARWPSNPNPVMSVAAWANRRSAISAPTRLSCDMSAIVFLESARDVRFRLIPVVTIPVPSGLVKISTSPGRALALVNIFRGST